MKEIALTNGGFAQVDNEDYERATRLNWYSKKESKSIYAYSTTKPHVFLHRLIMGFPDMQVDHRDGNGLNCRRGNLRVATHGQNRSARHYKAPNLTSRFKGVSFESDRQKYRAKIRSNGQQFHLGRFDTEEGAALAYNDAAKVHFGEFAVLNTL